MAKSKSSKAGRSSPTGGVGGGLFALESLFAQFNSHLGAAGRADLKKSREEQAQDLYYQAMDAPNPKRMLQMLDQVLELDPEHVDTLLLVTSMLDETPAERIESLRGIVSVARKKLGPKAFKEYAGHFWGFLETRPFMRAKEQLARVLLEAGRFEEAQAEFREMLELNPHDNQGVRYEMLPMVLLRGDLPAAQALLKQYKDDWSVVWGWGRVLERLLAQKPADAEKKLKEAREQNAHVEAFLVGRKKLPKKLPGMYSPGTVEEAVCYAAPLIAAWKAHPAAIDWLKGQGGTKGASPATKKKKSDE